MNKDNFLAFQIGEKGFCLKTKDIRSIQRLNNITPVNHPNPNLIGVSVIHEEIYSCISLNGSIQKNYIIILNLNDVNVGIACSKIQGFSKEIKHYLISANELALNDFRFNTIQVHKCFHFSNKEKACNLIQLYETLLNFNDVSHHIYNNDFAKWILDVLNLPKIAKSIEKTKTSKEIISILKTILEQ